MSGVGVEFIGGPLDGQLLVMACDDLMDPPSPLDLPEFSAWPVPTYRTHRYEREPHPGDEGPLWLYRWAGEQR